MAPGLLGIFGKRDKSRSPRPSAALPQPPWASVSSHEASAGPSSSRSTASASTAADRDREHEGSQLSAETDYVLPDADSIPASHNVYPHLNHPSPPSASSTKLNMFRRRKQSTPGAPPAPPSPSSKINLNDSPPRQRPPKSSSTSTSSQPSTIVQTDYFAPQPLHPPPSRANLFAQYGDSASSTHSLPQHQSHVHLRTDSHDSSVRYETMSNPDPHAPPVPPKKKAPATGGSSGGGGGGGLFAWARSRDRSKSKPPRPGPEVLPPSLPSVDQSSFNLKSFRHVNGSRSPLQLPERPPSSASVYAPPVRPRGNSFASDSSQRISVAAFREAQARRSAAGSPVQTFGDGLRPESPSAGPSPRLSPSMSQQQQQRGRQRSSTVGSPSSQVLVGPPITRTPLPQLPQPSAPFQNRTSKANLFSGSSTESSSSEESESEEEEDNEDTLRPTRKRTITQKPKAESELGHRSGPHPLSSPFASPSPFNLDVNRGSPYTSPVSRGRAGAGGSGSAGPSPRISPAQSSSTPTPHDDRANLTAGAGNGVYLRARGSVSTSALVPSATARRASLISKKNATASSSKAAPARPVIARPRSRLNSASSTSSDSGSSDSSEDDAPLASFMLPSRPGSAASNGSRGPAKPLIDIKALTKQPLPRRTLDDSPRQQTDARRSPDSGRAPRKDSFGVSERLAQLATGLAAGSSKSPPSSPPTQSPPSSKFTFPPTKLKVDTASARPTSSGSTVSPGASAAAAAESSPSPIVPTPIRQRQPAPSFSVMSRPISHASSNSVGTITGAEASAMRDASGGARPTVRMVQSAGTGSQGNALPRPQAQPAPRTASSSHVTMTLVSRIPKNDVTGEAPASFSASPTSYAAPPPPKPFTTGLLRDNSPASSTGDSSSGRMPATPRDGSDIGARSAGDEESAVGKPSSMAGSRKPRTKRASVSFMDEPEREKLKTLGAGGSGGGSWSGNAGSAEEKRKERRRTEAKASIALGKVINGRGPIVDDDDDGDDERPVNMGPRMNMGMSMLGANPMMNMSMPTNLNVPFPTGDYNNMGQPSSNTMSMNMNMNMGMMGMGMGMGMGMDPSAMNPMMMAAHQQAMMIAKQTYQLAVAQQAMQDAADEWERGSSVSGWGGGGGGRASVAPSSVNVPTGGMPMMNGMFPGAMSMGMGMGMGGLSPGGMNMGMGWQGGAGMMFPQGPRSMYTGSVYAASDAGGSVAGGGWGSRSAYGENFGGDRPPRSSRPNHGSPASASVAGGGGGNGGNGSRKDGPRTRTRTAPSSGPGQAPGKRGGQALLGAVSPPSSWRGPS